MPLKNLHVPLPDKLHDGLRAESKRTRRPATALARQAIEAWLKEQQKRVRHEKIAAFASATAGTRLDLDPDLEQASLDHLAELESKH